MATIREIIKKYENLLKEDRYDEFFSKCQQDERRIFINYAYNKVGVDVLEFMSSIPSRMFQGTEISSITIPSSITSIGNMAFADSSVVTIYMEDSVVDMGTGVFKGCTNLSKIRLSRSLEKIPNEAFMNCYQLSKIYIPESVKIIGLNAFKGCDDILIVADFRTNQSDKLKFMASETDFYKSHLKFKKR